MDVATHALECHLPEINNRGNIIINYICLEKQPWTSDETVTNCET